MIQVIADGGPLALLVVMTAAAAVPLLAIEARLKERTRFPGVHEGLVAILAGAAVGGALAGAMNMLGAIAHIDGDMHGRLLAMGTAITVIPVGLAAGALVGLGPVMALSRRSEAMERVRAARAVPWVTALSITAVCASTLLGTMLVFEVGSALAHEGRLPEVAGQVQWLAQWGAFAGLAAIPLGVANVLMGIVGGLRGLSAR